MVALALLVSLPGAATGSPDELSASRLAAFEYKRLHGYLPLDGADTLERQKAYAARGRGRADRRRWLRPGAGT